MLHRTGHSDSETARNSFPDYFSILEGRRKPRFRTCDSLDEKLAEARKTLESCTLCERRCKVNRSGGERGFCGVLEPRIASEFIHLGEEPELVPSYTLFFAGCNFRCVYCQNWDISQNPGNGVELTPQMTARLIKSQRARNVNWVGGEPTPNLPFVLEVLNNLDCDAPQVWNSNMYMTEEAMKMLDGVVDVYLTDFKYGSDECARRLSKAGDYLRVAKRNHLEAARQCETLVRHLMLPGHYDCCTKPVLEWIADEMQEARVNLMDQYRPAYMAHKIGGIDRRISSREYDRALDYARSLELNLAD